MNILHLIGREKKLFDYDLKNNYNVLKSIVSTSRFLVIGASGSIGQAVTTELFKLNPSVLHAVDISENNLVELVRNVRSTLGYTSGDFRTFAIDCGSEAFEVFFNNEGPYDFVLNLSALKHVRSEKDCYTLMRMIDVNIFNTLKSLRLAKQCHAKKYFCVSTDKAANPVNMMGGSKRIMENFLFVKAQNKIFRCLDLQMLHFRMVHCYMDFINAYSSGNLLLHQTMLKGILLHHKSQESYVCYLVS